LDFLDFGKFLRITNGTNVEALFTADSNAWMQAWNENEQQYVLAILGLFGFLQID
jgi:hypothetical protein